jgi:hypothetical protein
MNRVIILLGLGLALLVVLLCGAGGYWFATRPSLLSDLPFATKDDQVKVAIERPSIPFKVFRPGQPALLDELLADSGVIGSDVTLTDSGGKVALDGSPKKPVSFTNNTPEILKICAYKKDDTARWAPLAEWTLGAGRTVEWPDGPPDFTLKVFRPQFLDKPLATETNVRDQASITITRP